MLIQAHLNDLYKACCSTETLWTGAKVEGIQQFELDLDSSSTFNRTILKRIRLGQLAEQFVFNQIEDSKGIDLIAENIQIKIDRRTLGELDAIIQKDKLLIHLEIVYKFYVYDPSQGASEIERWIGPNRKDSLKEKLAKLKTKQFPLLYHESTVEFMNELEIDVKNLEQQVLFKAQLFTPYTNTIAFELLNPKCVQGFYIHKQDLNRFEANLFYIPTKYDWMLDPNDTVEWQSLVDFRIAADVWLSQQYSPLFWMKTPEGILQKGFLVWW